MKKISVLLTMLLFVSMFAVPANAAGEIKTGGLNNSIVSISSNEVIYGDIDQNKTVEIADVLYAQKHLAKILTLNSEQILRGDVDGNGSVELTDVLFIQKYIAKFLIGFPVEGGQIEAPTKQTTTQPQTTLPKAEDGENLTSRKTVSVEKGDIITYKVNLQALQSLFSCKVYFYYDKTKMMLDSDYYSNGCNYTKVFSSTNVNTNTSGKVSFSGTSSTGTDALQSKTDVLTVRLVAYSSGKAQIGYCLKELTGGMNASKPLVFYKDGIKELGGITHGVAEDTLSISDFSNEVFELVNKERKAAGVPALTYRKDLQSAADLRAKETVTKFSHTCPDGRKFSTALTDKGITYSYCAENIAFGQWTPSSVIKAWMDSPAHKANILSTRATGLAVGTSKNSAGLIYWQQFFIS